MTSKRMRKGKTKAKANKRIKPIQCDGWSLKDKFKHSGLGDFIAEHSDRLKEEGKTCMRLEPHGWLDYACVGVSERHDQVNAIYDLNILEHIYAMMFAYEETKDKVSEINIHALPIDEHLFSAQEHVEFNTLRTFDYEDPKQGAPLFIRSHNWSNLQVTWLGVW